MPSAPRIKPPRLHPARRAPAKAAKVPSDLQMLVVANATSEYGLRFRYLLKKIVNIAPTPSCNDEKDLIDMFILGSLASIMDENPGLLENIGYDLDPETNPSSTMYITPAAWDTWHKKVLCPILNQGKNPCPKLVVTVKKRPMQFFKHIAGNQAQISNLTPIQFSFASLPKYIETLNHGRRILLEQQNKTQTALEQSRANTPGHEAAHPATTNSITASDSYAKNETPDPHPSTRNASLGAAAPPQNQQLFHELFRQVADLRSTIMSRDSTHHAMMQRWTHLETEKQSMLSRQAELELLYRQALDDLRSERERNMSLVVEKDNALEHAAVLQRSRFP